MKTENLQKIQTPIKTALITLTLLFTGVNVYAQSDSIKYDIRLSALASSGQYAPFWLQNNQFGKISFEPFSSNLSVEISKDLKISIGKVTRGSLELKYGSGSLIFPKLFL